MATKKDKKLVVIPLKIRGASEDVPRLLTALGPACEDSNILYVMVPALNEAILVQAHKPAKGSPRGTKEHAHIWRTDLGLAPSHHPEIDIDIDKAVTEAKALMEREPGAGPTVIKGQWSGKFICDGNPRIELSRKVVAYGVLKLVSKNDGRWAATFTREKRWYTEAKEESAERSSLREAINAGYGLVMGLVSEACAVRDTRRRGAFDTSAKPVKPAKDADTKKVATYTEKRTGVPALKDVKVAEPCPTCEDGMVTAVKDTTSDAKRLERAAVGLDDVKDSPKFLTRAANLIRRAGSLLESPMCKAGPDKSAAETSLRRAVAAYNEARRAYVDHNDANIELVQRLRKIAEEVALAAAKTGRACAIPAKGPRATVSKEVADGFGLGGMPNVSVRRPSSASTDGKADKPAGKGPTPDKGTTAKPKKGKEADTKIGLLFGNAVTDLAAQIRAGAV